MFNTPWALNKQREARRAKLSGFHLHYGSRSLWLYRVSAAQDVVQQLILRLIHFLLNCLQTAAVIQPVPTNPRHCLAHSFEELGHVEAPHSSTSALSNCVCVTAQRDAGTVSVGKGSFISFQWESIDALKLPRYHLELCIELNLLPNRVLARWISLHNTSAIRDYSALLQSRFLSCTFVQNSYKNGIFWDSDQGLNPKIKEIEVLSLVSTMFENQLQPWSMLISFFHVKY